MWDAIAELAKEKRGPVLALTLEGAKKQAVLSILLESLEVENGLEALLNKLNDTLRKETADELYTYYERFERICSGCYSMASFIVDFEQLYSKLQQHGLRLPDERLVFKQNCMVPV